MVKGYGWRTTSGASLITDDSTWEKKGIRKEHLKNEWIWTYFSLCACYQGNKWLRVTQPSAVENMSLAKIHFLPRQQKNSAEKVQLEDMGLQLLIQRHTSSLHPFKNCCHNAFFYMSECGFCLQKNVFYCEPYIKCYCCVWVSSWQWLVFHDIFTVIDLISVT